MPRGNKYIYQLLNFYLGENLQKLRCTVKCSPSTKIKLKIPPGKQIPYTLFANFCPRATNTKFANYHPVDNKYHIFTN